MRQWINIINESRVDSDQEDMLIAAVTKDPYIFKELLDQGREMSPRVVDAAIRNNPNIVTMISNPTVDQQVHAVTKIPSLITGYKNPCGEAQVAAIKQLKGAASNVISQINGPLSLEAINLAIEYNPHKIAELFDNLPFETQRIAMNTDPRVYHVIKKYPSFDESLTKVFDQYVKEKNREYKLPIKGYISGIGGMNQDQLKLIRWFELNDRDSISVKELKSYPWGNTPYFLDLTKKLNGKDITKAILKADKQSVDDGLADKLINMSAITLEKWDGAQRLFTDKQNFAAVFSITGEELTSMMELDPETESRFENIRIDPSHPKSLKKTHASPKSSLILRPTASQELKIKPNERYTVGWVRFTMFDKDIWIDEVQSDLSKIIPESAAEFKNISEILLLTFIRKMRQRGTNKFYMPTPDLRNGSGYYPKGYGVNPETQEPLKGAPTATYDALPKKMRFKREVVNGLDSRVNGDTAWVLESYSPKI